MVSQDSRPPYCLAKGPTPPIMLLLTAMSSGNRPGIRTKTMTEHRPYPRRRSRVRAILCSIAVAALSLCTLAGCGLIGQSYINIEWYSDYFEKYYVRWFDDFQKQHADQHVRIQFRAMPSSAKEKVYTMLISHTLSDIIGVGSETAPLLFRQDALEPVAKADLDTSDFMPISIKLASRADGTLVSYPTGSGLRPFLYYTRKSLDEGKTNEDLAPETFDEYIPWASKMLRWDVNGKEVFGPLSESEAANARMTRRPIVMIRGYVRSSIPFIVAYIDPLPDADGKSDNSIDDFVGGPPSNRPFRFTHPDFIKGLREYQRWFKPRVTAIADSDANGEVAWQHDVYGAFEGANWVYGEVLGLNYVATRFPHAPGKISRLYTEAGSVGVSRESKHKAIAIEFAKFLASSEAQIDAYYGHGYLPCRFSAWKRLLDDAEVDKSIREKFLTEYGDGHGDFLGVPEVKRRYRDAMDVSLFVPLPLDQTIVKATSGTTLVPQEEEEAPQTTPEGQPKRVVDTRELEAKLKPVAENLAAKISAFSGQTVSVIVRGTPPEMVGSRSFVMKSPIPVYMPLLKDSGVWVPQEVVWLRLQTEVISRMLEFLERENDPMTPEQAAAWAQKEAEDIVAGRK
jgi:ABC-type glycerol-3-phosphate transport system substrate-binding protein